MFQLEIIEWSI